MQIPMKFCCTNEEINLLKVLVLKSFQTVPQASTVDVLRNK